MTIDVGTSSGSVSARPSPSGDGPGRAGGARRPVHLGRPARRRRGLRGRRPRPAQRSARHSATGAGPHGFTFVPLDPGAAVRVGDRLSTGPAGSAASSPASRSARCVRCWSADGDDPCATVRPPSRPAGLDLVGVIVVDLAQTTARPLGPVFEPGWRPVTRRSGRAALAGAAHRAAGARCLVGPLTVPVPVSLPALLVAAVALVDGPGVGMAFGFAAGLLADLGSEHPAGVLALCWMAWAWSAGCARHPAPYGLRDAGLAAARALSALRRCCWRARFSRRRDRLVGGARRFAGHAARCAARAARRSRWYACSCAGELRAPHVPCSCSGCGLDERARAADGGRAVAAGGSRSSWCSSPRWC